MSTTLNGITRVCSEEALPCSQTLGGLGHPSTGSGAEGTSVCSSVVAGHLLHFWHLFFQTESIATLSFPRVLASQLLLR